MSLSPEQLRALAVRIGPEELKRQAYRHRMRTSLKDFAQEAWKVIEPHQPLKWNWHHELMCHHLQRVTAGEETRLLINVPPGSAKSSIVCVLWPSWCWLERPWYQSIYSSYDDGLILRDAEKTQTIVESAWYQDLIPARFGDQKNSKWNLDKGRTALSYYQTTERGYRCSVTVKGANTGHRGHVVICDDPQKAADARSQEMREKTILWWDKTMSSRVNDPAKSAYVIIMQRLHEEDLAGHIIARDAAEQAAGNTSWRPWTKVLIPLEYDPDMHTDGDPRTVKGELMHPEMVPRAIVDEMRKTLGPYDYGAQAQQNPVPRGAGIIDCSKLKFWYPDNMVPPPEPHFEPECDTPNAQHPLPQGGWSREVQSWDMTFKDTLNSDMVCGQVWRSRPKKKTSAEGMFYLVDQVLERMSFSKTLDAVQAMRKRHRKATAIYIEDKANGPAAVDVLTKTLSGIVAVNPEGGKEARATAVSPFVTAGDVVLPHPAVFPWVYKMLKELRGFPKVKHDDQVDAMTQALMKLHKGNMDWLRAMVKR